MRIIFQMFILKPYIWRKFCLNSIRVSQIEMFELFWLALVAAENFDLNLNFNTISLGPGRVKGRQESWKSIIYKIWNLNKFVSFTIIINNIFLIKKKFKKLGFEVYYGIPYAQPPVGDLRWRPPVNTSSWEEEKG